MKVIITLLFLTSFYICNGQENESKYISSFNKFINLTDGYSEIPESLILKHLGEGWIDNDDPYKDFSGDNFASFKIGKISFATVDFGHHGVCSETILFSFNSEGKLISSLTIGRGCDQPLDEREYEGTNYNLISKEIIVIIACKSVAIGESILESDYSENDTEEYEKYEFYSILPDGNFSLMESTEYVLTYSENSNSSKELLAEKNLAKYSREELRILRNEIFAKKGYIFKSTDLREYFKQFDWYKPTSKDVNESLSLIEKSNVQIILKAESKKKTAKKMDRENATIVLDGFFVKVDKKTITKMLGQFQIKDSIFINPDVAIKTTGLIGSKGLFIINTDMPLKETLSRFASYMFYDQMPIYIINETDTLNDFKGINPASIDSIVPIAPYKAALKFGRQYNGGIIKIYKND